MGMFESYRFLQCRQRADLEFEQDKGELDEQHRFFSFRALKETKPASMRKATASDPALSSFTGGM